jgi:dTDP-4-amino-4,6-dideoxygalactose transaminase
MPYIPIAKPKISISEILNVVKVMRTGNLAQGPEVRKFENGFSKYLNDQPVVAVNSGTSALHLSLLSLGITTGDEVLVPSFSFAASANAIALTGATPIFVDINHQTYNLDPTQLKEKITKQTRAILVVHLYGLPADMEEIMKIAKTKNLLVIEDSAQAHLADINGKPVGTFGDAAAFSFYPTKNMTTGEGGIATFKSEDHARTAKLLRNQGMEKRYYNEIVGFNLRMTDIAAAIGLAQLNKIEKWTDARRENAAYFNSNLNNVVTPHVPGGFSHSYHQYTIRVKNNQRNLLQEHLEIQGIGSSIYYPTLINELPAYNQYVELPESKKATEELLSIPIYPQLRKKSLEKIKNQINQFFEINSYE